jgi:hypothetical protein
VVAIFLSAAGTTADELKLILCAQDDTATITNNRMFEKSDVHIFQFEILPHRQLHFPAFVCAFEACFCTLPAVFVLVIFALVITSFTYVRANQAKVFRFFASKTH